MRNMLEIHGGQSLTQAMQQRISEYSLEVRYVPRYQFPKSLETCHVPLAL